MQLHVYLTFNGNCRDAMQFYRDCLGGKLELQTIGAALPKAPIPETMKHYILHAQLSHADMMIMATDIVDDNGLRAGNAVSIMLRCHNQSELESCYNKLASGATRLSPPTCTHWNALLGSLTDRYGNNWLLCYYPDIP